MKISMRLSVILSVIFAAISLGDIADPAQRADGQGFAWFWAFLGAVAAAFALLGMWMLRTHGEGGDA
jgi:hypothetical protein